MKPPSKTPRLLLVAALAVTVSCVSLGPHVVTVRSSERDASRPARSWAEVFAQPTALSVEPLLSGWVKAGPDILIDQNNPRTPESAKREQWVPSPFDLVKHPTRGWVVFDTGVSSGNCSYGARPFFWVPCQPSPDGDLVTQLRRRGVRPDQLAFVVLSHGHGDHASGLRALEREHAVPVLVTEDEWRAMSSGTRLFSGYLTEQLVGTYPVTTVSFVGAEVMPEVGPAIDLFGDGSIWLIDAKGHTAGGLAVVINAAEGPTLLMFDASHLEEGFQHDVVPGFVVSRDEAAQTLARLRGFVRATPALKVYYGHEPSQWPVAPAP